MSDAIENMINAVEHGANKEPVAEVFDTFGNSQDPTKCVIHAWTNENYCPRKGEKLFLHPQPQKTPQSVEEFIEQFSIQIEWLRKGDDSDDHHRVVNVIDLSALMAGKALVPVDAIMRASLDSELHWLNELLEDLDADSVQIPRRDLETTRKVYQMIANSLLEAAKGE